MTGPVGKAYSALVAAGELKADPDPQAAVTAIDRFAARLAEGDGLVRKLLGKSKPPGGLYLWGGVGRGKSMLMDLAYDTILVEPKRRTHFAPFMIEVHERLREARRTEEGDPVIAVAGDIADEVRVLCFDEMMVNNPADAMIMSRLFTALIEARMAVLPLNGPTDYRLDRLAGLYTWLVPSGPEATAKLSEAFFRLTDYPVEDRANVPVEELDVGGGRTMHVPKSLKGVAVFSFKRLCGEARGAADYLAIARRFHTVILVGIPVMTREMRNEASRFVTLIDQLYEHRVKLLAAADAEPAGLYPAGDGRFEFARTVSRLEEMQSADYLAEGHGTA